MASKLEIQTELEVGIEALWNAITKDKLDLLRKAAPQLLTDAQVIEGDGGLGTLTTIDISAAAPHVPPFKEKIVEFDEANHAVSFQGIEGGFLKLGFTHYNVSFKLDDLANGKILAKTTITYELEKDIDGTQLVEEFSNFAVEYLKTVATYLQKAS
ncbi:phytohormone-binding protein CSBP-like [Dendrobium catenatum]|uniref:Putative intracellular pathogenesis-related protein T1 n=1 Tax=Dendrobium catenatum TaxID=906689 RepID=A0A2I0X9N5_9ASPA|nr:phytohormone-binding protein CSBP-like [Dendrobium catenatum]PKU84612.1 putative intracellular pathogenesis-related protein T1 [Dendrobium catenatum]